FRKGCQPVAGTEHGTKIRSGPMSRHIQITFDAHDPRALSTFWRDVLGYVHPGPPGVDLPEGADPLAAWDDFHARIGVPEDQRNTRSAIEDPDGQGPRLFFQQVPEDKVAKIGRASCRARELIEVVD